MTENENNNNEENNNSILIDHLLDQLKEEAEELIKESQQEQPVKKTKKVKCLSKYYLFIPSVKCYYTFVRKKDKKITKIPFWPKSPSHKRKAGFLKKLVRCESILLIYYPPKHLVTSLEEHPAVYPAAGCFSFSILFQFLFNSLKPVFQ